ncbi:MAG: TSUP family transporter [Aliishimia sp.]
MELTSAFYVVSILSILLTGISKSGFGGGLGVMSVPLMSLFVAPQFAAAVLMPILLAMDILIVWRYRRTWDRRIIVGLGSDKRPSWSATALER